MTEGDAVVGALRETTVFLSYFADFPDYRKKGKIAPPLDEAPLLLSGAALSGAERALRPVQPELLSSAGNRDKFPGGGRSQGRENVIQAGDVLRLD
jgi:hypothetical protein